MDKVTRGVLLIIVNSIIFLYSFFTLNIILCIFTGFFVVSLCKETYKYIQVKKSVFSNYNHLNN